MTWEAIVHQAVRDELPAATHAAARMAMRGVARSANPARAAGVEPLEGTRVRHSYRVRTGRHRICFVWFPDARAVVFTTAFLKRRESDYRQAVTRHETRVRQYE